MSRVVLALTVLATGLAAAPHRTFTMSGPVPGTGDLYVGVGDLGYRESRGKYVVLGAAGTPTGRLLQDKERGYTEGCAVDPATGYVWTTSGPGNALSVFDDRRSGEDRPALLQTFSVRAFAWAGGQARGAVGSVAFDANGHVYAGTRDGSNRLLKLTADGTLLESFALPAGVFAFDLAADQHTVYYTSREDSVVRRYDLAARTPLPHLATLIDGSIYNLRLLPGDQGLLVAGSVGVTRLALNGAFVARYWLPETQLYGLSLGPEGRTFWTSNMRGQLLKFDIASERLVAGPVDSGFRSIRGLCARDEYLAARGICRVPAGDGTAAEARCPMLEICGNLVDDDGDSMADEQDADCRVPGWLHELPPGASRASAP